MKETPLELDSDDVAYFTKTVSQILRASVIGEATNINFVRLSGAEFNTGARHKEGSDNEKKARTNAAKRA